MSGASAADWFAWGAGVVVLFAAALAPTVWVDLRWRRRVLERALGRWQYTQVVCEEYAVAGQCNELAQRGWEAVSVVVGEAVDGVEARPYVVLLRRRAQ